MDKEHKHFMTVDTVAAICHDANRRLCVSLGDRSQPAWEDAPDWQVDSALLGVRFNIENPDAPPSASHARPGDDDAH